MSRYRKIEVRMWSDKKFCALSRPQPSGQALWLFLLTGPHTGPIPGLFRAGRGQMADELGWDLDGFDGAFQEIIDQGMVEADMKAKLIWLPNALKLNRPDNPNVVKSWLSEWEELPECDLKDKVGIAILEQLSEYGDNFAAVFSDALKNPSYNHSDNPSDNRSDNPSDNPSDNRSDNRSGKGMPNQDTGNRNRKQEQDNKNTHTGNSEYVGEIEIAGRVCVALRDVGIMQTNPSHADLLQLIRDGTTMEEFVSAGSIAAEKGKGFSYALGVAKSARLEKNNGKKHADTKQKHIETSLDQRFAEKYAGIG